MSKDLENCILPPPPPSGFLILCTFASVYYFCFFRWGGGWGVKIREDYIVVHYLYTALLAHAIIKPLKTFVFPMYILVFKHDYNNQARSKYCHGEPGG